MAQAISAVSPGAGMPNDWRVRSANMSSNAQVLFCSMKLVIDASGGAMNQSSRSELSLRVRRSAYG